jgi:hypothetical protein
VQAHSPRGTPAHAADNDFEDGVFERFHGITQLAAPRRPGGMHTPEADRTQYERQSEDHPPDIHDRCNTRKPAQQLMHPTNMGTMVATEAYPS